MSESLRLSSDVTEKGRLWKGGTKRASTVQGRHKEGEHGPREARRGRARSKGGTKRASTVQGRHKEGEHGPREAQRGRARSKGGSKYTEIGCEIYKLLLEFSLNCILILATTP